jgi:hypothetical protein
MANGVQNLGSTEQTGEKYVSNAVLDIKFDPHHFPLSVYHTECYPIFCILSNAPACFHISLG